MKINEKLLKPLSEINYLRAENVERYRVIIRYFYEEYEKIHYWMHKEDVYEMMIQTGLFPDYTLELCQSDLSQLTEWKNLEAMQDTTKVLTIEEFKNRKYRYQLSDYTIEIERMMIRLENLEVEGASLEPSLLERIHKRICEIKEISQKDISEVSIWWNDLNNDFIRLNRNYQDYIRTLSSARAEEMMKTNEFLIFKDQIIQYLRNFVKGLQEQALVLEEYIKEVDETSIMTIFDKVCEYEMSIPRIERKIEKEEIYENIKGRWQSIHNWFVGENSVSEVERMSDITSDIIRKITRYAQQIGELYNIGANRKEEYRHIAHIFGMCQNINEAHKMSSMVFGVDTCLHLKNLNVRETDSIDSGVYDEDPTYYDLEPRIRIIKNRSKRLPAQDYTLEKEIQRQQHLDRIKNDQNIIMELMKENTIDFSKLPMIDGYTRKLLLNLLSRGLADLNHAGKCEWGADYWIDDSHLKMCEVKCEDGDFYMPSFRIHFRMEEFYEGN